MTPHLKGEGYSGMLQEGRAGGKGQGEAGSRGT